MDLLHGGLGGMDEPPTAGSDSVLAGRESSPAWETGPKTPHPQRVPEAATISTDAPLAWNAVVV